MTTPVLAAVQAVEADLLTPALVLDLDAVAHNVAAVIARAGSARRWRPHVKTVKQSVLVNMMLQAGVRSLKCATPDELELVLRCVRSRGIEGADVLVAYPLYGAALRRVMTARDRHRETRVTVLADSPEHLAVLAAAAPIDRPTEVFVDVDVGMGRTGSSPERWDAALASALPSGVRLVGLHGYDGHLGFDERERAFAGYDALERLGARLPELELVVTSGTHSYAHALAYVAFDRPRPLHQISCGTVVLSDLRSEPAAADLGLRQAVYVASRVVSAPRPDRITLDAGSKGIAPDRPPPSCSVVDHPGLVAERASEEHLPVRVAAGTAPAPGSLVLLVPDHACTTVNLYRRALWVRGGRVVGDGPIEAASHSLWGAGA